MNDYIKMSRLSKYDNDVASRQKLIPSWKQDKLEQARVLVVGAGALGNEVVKNLILFGVGNIYVIDFDHVVISNLNRCIFFRRDDAFEHRAKVDALAQRASELTPYPHTKVYPVNADIQTIPYDHELYVNSQVYVSCLDSLAARLVLNSAALQNMKPLVDGGMSGFIGYVQVVIPGYTACLHCNVADYELKAMYHRLSCSGTPLEFTEPKIPALPTTTSLLGAVMAQEVVKILLGIDYFLESGAWPKETGLPLAGKRFFANTALNFYGVYDLDKNPKCEVCSSFQLETKNLYNTEVT